MAFDCISLASSLLLPVIPCVFIHPATCTNGPSIALELLEINWKTVKNNSSHSRTKHLNVCEKKVKKKKIKKAKISAKLYMVDGGVSSNS